ncbi:MAG: hypothetical protein FE78DRAFT_105559 [Acidomyces sp. 'richmondensis']|nr:MAG: hypothetical protein FE78DRAFT_105559 [Acidomyces sp. 'richmondensis']
MGERLFRAGQFCPVKNFQTRDLSQLGHTQSLSRKFSLWSMLALAFSVLGTWSTFEQDLAGGLTNGGAVTILCELCSAMPTSLEQAYWILRLWNTPVGRFVAYCCAWINMFGWTITASQIAFMTEFLLAIKVIFDNSWVGAGQGWTQFVLWPNPVVWFTGLIQAAYGLAAFDSIIDMAEEIPDSRRLPKFPYLAVIIGAATGGVFMLVCLFCIQDNSLAIKSPMGLPFAFWIGLIGVLYYFANTVPKAILSVSTIVLTISYVLPVLDLLIVERDELPVRKFHLGGLGLLCNWVSIVYCCITTVFFFSPRGQNSNIEQMDWAIAVLGL